MMVQVTRYEDFKAEALQDPEVRAAYIQALQKENAALREEIGLQQACYHAERDHYEEQLETLRDDIATLRSILSRLDNVCIKACDVDSIWEEWEAWQEQETQPT